MTVLFEGKGSCSCAFAFTLVLIVPGAGGWIVKSTVLDCPALRLLMEQSYSNCVCPVTSVQIPAPGASGPMLVGSVTLRSGEEAVAGPLFVTVMV